MKKDIHLPLYQTHYVCSCGSDFHIESSTEGEVKIDVCSACHPLYTGKAKTVDTEGRIERFNKKYKNA